MKKILLIAYGFIGMNSILKAATVFQFNEGFSGGISSNLSNAAGLVGIDGLNWGVIVDINGGALSTSSFDYIPYTSGATVALTSNSTATDAVMVFASSVTGDQTLGFYTDVGGTTGTVGGVGTLSVNYTNGIAAGQSFYLVWFDSFNASGYTAGILSSVQFVLPTDTGAIVPVDDVFIGADPVRAATGLTFSAIPEPSTFLLASLGVLGLLRRRR